MSGQNVHTLEPIDSKNKKQSATDKVIARQNSRQNNSGLKTSRSHEHNINDYKVQNSLRSSPSPAIITTRDSSPTNNNHSTSNSNTHINGNDDIVVEKEPTTPKKSMVSSSRPSPLHIRAVTNSLRVNEEQGRIYSSVYHVLTFL